MKDVRFNSVIFTVLLLLAAVANAQEYPAADFQPKVVYQDASVAALSSTSAAPAASQAAAPCVTQQSSATPAKQEAASEFDPQYPASSFQPKVVFSQAN